MAVKSDRLSPAEHLARRIRDHHAEVARLREEFGDPTEALRAFLRERFDPEALQATYEEYLQDKHGWLDHERATDADGRSAG